VSFVLRTIVCLLCVFPPLLRAEQCLVFGDSLTKEYEFEFPLLFRNNPASWQARNWIEILHQHRTDWFDTGPWGSYSIGDPRIAGHRHNWAFPGATTGDIRNQLTSLYSALWRGTLENQLRNDVERVVIFAGGNDADSYYANLYNGLVGSEVTNTTLVNLQWLVNYVRTVNASLPIVLVSVPHVGCTPQVQQGYPTDPVKTARVTAAMDALNASLAAWAQSQGIGFVPEVYEFTKAIITQPFRIRGIEFYRVADADSRVRYVFSGDGFHPGTCAHTKIAQWVVNAFQARYPGTPMNRLDDRYIITQVLGLDPAIPFTEWMAAQGITGGFADDFDRDGTANGLEFALDQPVLPLPVMENGTLTMTWRPRDVFAEWGLLKVQSGPDLGSWFDVPVDQTTANPDGSLTVRLTTPGHRFLRLHATGG
jgi:lysophospholipase L1-like esterase